MRRALLLCLLLAAATAPASAQTWLFESAQAIPSTDTGWGGITLDPAGGRLFIARRDDGLLVWDTHLRQSVTVENSKGANAVVLVPEVHRGYAAMTDGTVLAFNLDTLAPITRNDLGAGDLARLFYEPTQKRVHVLSGGGPEKTAWITLDAATGEVLGRTEFNSRTMDTPTTDGAGAIYAPQRDRGLLVQLDANTLALQKTWKLGDCSQPAAVHWDQPTERILVACRGDKPVFVALNPATGIVATIPIGRGVRGMAMDASRHLIVTANGTDATLSVIRQDGADGYTLVETISTRPMASGLQLDPSTGRLFTVTATFTLPAPGAEAKPAADAKPIADAKPGADANPSPTFYHPDSFTILTYHRP